MKVKVSLGFYGYAFFLLVQSELFVLHNLVDRYSKQGLIKYFF